MEKKDKQLNLEGFKCSNACPSPVPAHKMTPGKQWAAVLPCDGSWCSAGAVGCQSSCTKGWRCAGCSSTPRAFHRPWKCIKCIWQAVKGWWVRFPRRLRSSAVMITGFFQELTLYFSFPLFFFPLTIAWLWKSNATRGLCILNIGGEMQFNYC